MSIITQPDPIACTSIREYEYCPRKYYFDRYGDCKSPISLSRVEMTQKSRDRFLELNPLAQVLEKEFISSPEVGLESTVEVVRMDQGYFIAHFRYGVPSKEGLWPGDKLQATAELYLSGQLGRCFSGSLFFNVTDDSLVIFVPTEEDYGRLKRVVEEMSGKDDAEVPPPPLVDSQRCIPCEVAGLCLPDEVVMLREGNLDRQVRKVSPNDPQRPLYLSVQGSYVRKKGDRIQIEKQGEIVESIRAFEVSQVCLFGAIGITTPLVNYLLSEDIEIAHFSAGGWFYGLSTGFPHGNIELRRRQFALAESGDISLARSFVLGKIKNSRTLLKRNSRQKVENVLVRLAHGITQAEKAETQAELLGIEGSAARDYFGVFQSMLHPGSSEVPTEFRFTGRNRRPPLDPVNAMLSYLYAILIKDMTAITFNIGLEPNLGYFHRPRYGRPALALDLSEEFRSIIADSVVVSLINRREIRVEDFIIHPFGVALTAEGRKKVLSGYERRLETEVTHHLFNYTVTYRRIMDLQARLLAGYILGDVPNYVPFMVR